MKEVIAMARLKKGKDCYLWEIPNTPSMGKNISTAEGHLPATLTIFGSRMPHCLSHPGKFITDWCGNRKMPIMKPKPAGYPTKVVSNEFKTILTIRRRKNQPIVPIMPIVKRHSSSLSEIEKNEIRKVLGNDVSVSALSAEPCGKSENEVN